MSKTIATDPKKREADILAVAGTAACRAPWADVSSAAKRAEKPHRSNLSIVAAVGVLLLGLLWWFDPAESHMPLCSFHAMTGLDCPGCGATRATHELLHGRLPAALHYNALWVLSLPLVGYLAVSELCVCSGRKPLPGDLARRTSFWIAVAAIATAFFVVRNLP